jgi:protein TonB
MSVLLEGDEQLERELTAEPIAAPATGSLVLHASLAAAIVLYGVLGGFFHSNLWGGSAAGGAIRVNLVSSALPLPTDQPPNQNVLATDKPSQAPVLPLPKAAPPTVDEKSIPVLGKQEKPKEKPAPKTPPKQPQPKQDNRAQYGEQAASSMPRAIQGQTTTNGPTSVSEGDFGSRFPYYVDGINRKMSTSWNKSEVDPRTPKGARVFLVFTIHRDGTPGDVQLDRSSGSPTLDRSCMRGVQRVDTFGPLPGGYNLSTLKVSYYCEY